MGNRFVSALEQIPEEFASADTVYEAFEDYVSGLGLSLYDAQQEAILAVLAGDNTIVATPTGSGKSMVALAAAYWGVSTGVRVYYTAPIKALVSEKFFDLSERLGADNVGMVTGDSSVNADAPVICATAEILANQALREGPMLDAGIVIMDEFHYFGDPQRGWAWQVPLLTLPQSQFVLMSATLGDTTAIAKGMEELTGRSTSYVTGAQRPVPLEFSYSEEPLQETLHALVRHDQAPVYVVSFSQRQAAELAGSIVSANLATREEREAIADEIRGFGFQKGFGTTLKRLLLHGIGVHHAGMLPKYRRLVEHLAGKGLLKVISGTDTLGIGINVPIRTVLLTALTKFDGSKMRRLTVREFQQIAGRAGRAGFDTVGFVVAQAPEHEIDNKKAADKAANSNKKRKPAKKQPPAGFVGWSQDTFENLRDSEVEELRSRMKITHSTVINLAARGGDVVKTVRDFIASTHETPSRKLDMQLRALRIGRALLNADVLVRTEEDGRVRFELAEDFGPQFALNQPLSPFALAALELFDPEADDWADNVLSVIEATTEVPYHVLRGQLDRLKGEEIQALKSEGVPYDERMAIIDEMELPRPNGDVLDEAFEAFTEHAPWLREIGIEPKAVVADMISQAMNFSQFVMYYKLARVEGGLLRYLTDVYRALVQTVPEDLVTESLQNIIDWLGDLVLRVDSSLVQEWEALRQAGAEETDTLPLEHAARKLTDDERAFTILVRNALFHRVLLAERAAYRALGELDGEDGWDHRQWEDAIEAFYDEYGDLGVGADARSADFVHIRRDGRTWMVDQILDDPEGDRDWAIRARVDLDASDDLGEPAVTIIDVAPRSEMES